MNVVSILQLFISSGLAIGFVTLIFQAGRLVQSIDNIDRRLGIVETDLKDIQSKVTVLWDQRRII